MDQSITITDEAIAQIIQVLEEANIPDGKFRIFITLDNRSGFQYGFAIDDEVNEDDIVIIKQFQGKNLSILIDTISIQYLEGATIDYRQKEEREMFVITNPNAGK